MLSLAQTPAFAQPIDQYALDRRSIRQRRRKRRAEPAGAGRRRIPSAIVARMRTLTDRQVRSAIMLHTELAAVLLANARAPQATAQIGNAPAPARNPDRGHSAPGGRAAIRDPLVRLRDQPVLRPGIVCRRVRDQPGRLGRLSALRGSGRRARRRLRDARDPRHAPQFQCDRRTRRVQRQARLRGRGSGVSAGVDGESQVRLRLPAPRMGPRSAWATVAPRPISRPPCAKRRTTASGIWPICFWARRLNGATIWRERAATSRRRTSSARSRRRRWRSAASSWRWATPIARVRSPRRSRSSGSRRGSLVELSARRLRARRDRLAAGGGAAP